MAEVIIMIGLPGSGKSTWVKDNTWGAVIICSSDHYFEGKGGKYAFDQDRLGQAHAQCVRRFFEACKSSELHDFIVVDNTNLAIAEIAPYMAAAQAYKLHIRPILIASPHPDVCFERQRHGLGRPTFDRFADKLNRTRNDWPGYWPKYEVW